MDAEVVSQDVDVVLLLVVLGVVVAGTVDDEVVLISASVDVVLLLVLVSVVEENVDDKVV